MVRRFGYVSGWKWRRKAAKEWHGPARKHGSDRASRCKALKAVALFGVRR